MLDGPSSSADTVLLRIPKSMRLMIRRAAFIILLITLFISVILSTVEHPIIVKTRHVVLDTLSPVLATLAWPFHATADGASSISDYFFVYQKNGNLRQHNEILKRELLVMQEVKTENSQLRQLLNYVDQGNYSYISARVVGNASGPFLRTVLLNAGSVHGVKKGQAVIGEKGLIGRITDVSERTSRVLLLTDISSKIPVITNKSRERSLLAGNNTDNPTLLYLPKDTQVSAKELVFTSGDGDLFPPNLQVGIIEQRSDRSFAVRPFSQWHRLEHVSILDFVPISPSTLSNTP